MFDYFSPPPKKHADYLQTYGLELDCVFFVGELQGKEGLIMSHIINVIPPAETTQSSSQTHDSNTAHKNRK